MVQVNHLLRVRLVGNIRVQSIIYDNAWEICDYHDILHKMDRDISEEDAEKVLAEFYEKAPWIEAIIIWVGVSND